MAISADWVSAIIAALSLGYLIGSGVQWRRDASRNAMPIIRASWSFGSAGFIVKVKLVNRLNEDLDVTKAECRTNFSETIDTRYDPATGKAEFTYEKKPSPMPLRWTFRRPRRTRDHSRSTAPRQRAGSGSRFHPVPERFESGASSSENTRKPVAPGSGA